VIVPGFNKLVNNRRVFFAKMAIVALAIKLDSFGPVLYRQERVGLNGRRFTLLKFRSMINNAEPDGQPVWAARRDIRITRVGRFIRCTRIDELPQLFNVLCGDMSWWARGLNALISSIS
jgi:lipopolysaccharide/colanic/teichoic acid biosynthesis glycosyltransferase